VAIFGPGHFGFQFGIRVKFVWEGLAPLVVPLFSFSIAEPLAGALEPMDLDAVSSGVGLFSEARFSC
jgi:hypothetical protein